MCTVEFVTVTARAFCLSSLGDDDQIVQGASPWIEYQAAKQRMFTEFIIMWESASTLDKFKEQNIERDYSSVHTHACMHTRMHTRTRQA